MAYVPPRPRPILCGAGNTSSASSSSSASREDLKHHQPLSSPQRGLTPSPVTVPGYPATRASPAAPTAPSLGGMLISTLSSSSPLQHFSVSPPHRARTAVGLLWLARERPFPPRLVACQFYARAVLKSGLWLFCNKGCGSPAFLVSRPSAARNVLRRNVTWSTACQALMVTCSR